MLITLFDFFSLYFRSIASARKALNLSDEARMFNRFGRRLGWRLILNGESYGVSYLVNPVNSFRYFEFPFALTALPDNPGRCLDVSSPSLFSFYVSQKFRPKSIWMINPDHEDIHRSAVTARKLKIPNIETECHGVDILEDRKESFDCIWSISVVEHISGKYDDRYAAWLMYQALAVGGRLILTIPVDRISWDEYRDQTYYGMPKDRSGTGSHFFQRYYDKQSLWKRIVGSIGVEPAHIGWFGEKNGGHFADYEKRWLRDGFECTFDDPREMSEHYQEFLSWDEMPGKGVCGLVFIKPLEK